MLTNIVGCADNVENVFSRVNASCEAEITQLDVTARWVCREQNVLWLQQREAKH